MLRLVIWIHSRSQSILYKLLEQLELQILNEEEPQPQSYPQELAGKSSQETSSREQWSARENSWTTKGGDVQSVKWFATNYLPRANLAAKTISEYALPGAMQERS